MFSLLRDLVNLHLRPYRHRRSKIKSLKEKVSVLERALYTDAYGREPIRVIEEDGYAYVYQCVRREWCGLSDYHLP